MSSVVCTGSFVGQESLGDRALLRCVAARLRASLGPGAELASIFSRASVPDLPSRLTPLLDPSSWSSYVEAGAARVHLNGDMSRPVAAALAAAMRPDWAMSAFRAQVALRSADLFYFYGGTQLAQSWFDQNWPGLEAMLASVQSGGGIVAFGPQQYGPLDDARKAKFLDQIDRVDALIRTRNEECRRSLGLSQDQLLFDEVFSCVPRFPVSDSRTERAEYILVNFRDTNFDDPEVKLGSDEGRWRFLLRLSRRANLPVVFFAMSGESFCDDLSWIQTMPASVARELRYRIEGYSTDDKRIVELARKALVTVSMSFHGCILSLIAGTPAIPLSDGKYYDHKYADFAKYLGGQVLPRLGLSGIGASDAEAAIEFAAICDLALIADARRTADRGMRQWYEEVAFAVESRRRGVGR